MDKHKLNELNRQLMTNKVVVQILVSDVPPSIQFNGQDWEYRVFTDLETIDNIARYACYLPPEKFVREYMKEHNLRNYLRPTEMHSEYTTEQRIAPLLSEMIKEYIKLKEE